MEEFFSKKWLGKYCKTCCYFYFEVNDRAKNIKSKFSLTQFAARFVLSLTADQEHVLKIVLEGHNVFISGQAGTGKSFLVKEIYKRLKQGGKKVTMCAQVE